MKEQKDLFREFIAYERDRIKENERHIRFFSGIWKRGFKNDEIRQEARKIVGYLTELISISREKIREYSKELIEKGEE